MTKWVLGTNKDGYFLSKEYNSAPCEITLTKRLTDALIMEDQEVGHRLMETRLNLYELSLEHIELDSFMLDHDGAYAYEDAVLALEKGSERYYMSRYGDKGKDKDGKLLDSFTFTRDFNDADLIKMRIARDMAQQLGLEVYMVRAK